MEEEEEEKSSEIDNLVVQIDYPEEEEHLLDNSVNLEEATDPSVEELI